MATLELIQTLSLLQKKRDCVAIYPQETSFQTQIKSLDTDLHQNSAIRHWQVHSVFNAANPLSKAEHSGAKCKRN